MHADGVFTPGLYQTGRARPLLADELANALDSADVGGADAGSECVVRFQVIKWKTRVIEPRSLELYSSVARPYQSGQSGSYQNVVPNPPHLIIRLCSILRLIADQTLQPFGWLKTLNTAQSAF